MLIARRVVARWVAARLEPFLKTHGGWRGGEAGRFHHGASNVKNLAPKHIPGGRGTEVDGNDVG